MIGGEIMKLNKRAPTAWAEACDLKTGVTVEITKLRNEKDVVLSRKARPQHYILEMMEK